MELLRETADWPRLEQPRGGVQTPEAVAAMRRLHELGFCPRKLPAATQDHAGLIAINAGLRVNCHGKSESIPEGGLQLPDCLEPRPELFRTDPKGNGELKGR